MMSALYFPSCFKFDGDRQEYKLYLGTMNYFVLQFITVTK